MCMNIISYHTRESIIAYDCSGLNMNVTTISLTHNKQCNDNIDKEQIITTRIQLIQRAEIKLIETFQCLLSIQRMIYYCGMHSHLSAVQNGFATLIRDIGEQNCRSIFQSKSISLTKTKSISDLRINQTIHNPITLIGKVNVDVTCRGESYSDFYGSWDNVVVLADVSITLKHNFDIYNYENSSVILKSGMRCVCTTGYCFDSDYSDTYWNFMALNSCSSSEVITSNYFVENQGSLFALRTIKKLTLCGQIIHISD